MPNEKLPPPVDALKNLRAVTPDVVWGILLTPVAKELHDRDIATDEDVHGQPKKGQSGQSGRVAQIR